MSLKHIIMYNNILCVCILVISMLFFESNANILLAENHIAIEDKHVCWGDSCRVYSFSHPYNAHEYQGWFYSPKPLEASNNYSWFISVSNYDITNGDSDIARMLHHYKIPGIGITAASKNSLKIISNMTWLKTLFIVNTPLTETALSPVASLVNIKHVIIKDCDNINKDIIEIICSLPKLETLCILGTSSIYADSIKMLIRCKNLKYLRLDEQNITPAHINSLPENITHLSICSDYIGNGILKIISKLKNIKGIGLVKCRGVSDKGVEYILENENIEVLCISGCNNITDRGLINLSNLKKLRILSIWDCKNIYGYGLGCISKLKSLENLYVKNCSKLTDNEMDAIDRCINIKRIVLHGCPELTDRTMAKLTGIPGLKYLTLWKCPRITDKGFVSIDTLINLKQLEIDACGTITDGTIKLISSLKNLITLSLFKCKDITDLSLCYISRLKQLQYLDIGYCDNVTDKGLRHLCRLSNLKELLLYNCKQINSKGIGYISRINGVNKLVLGKCNINNESAQYLEKMKSLKYLDLSCTDITSVGSGNIGCLSGLKELEMISCLKLDEVNLTKCQYLEDLDLRNCRNIKDGSLLSLGSNKHIRSLLLSDCRNITDKALIILKDMKNIEVLDLARCYRITDIGLNNIVNCKALYWISVNGCVNVSNEGVARLSRLPSIKYLYLDMTNIDDTALEYLSNMKHLKELTLFGCQNISDEGLKHLLINKKLSILDLSACRNVTDKSICILSQYPSISELYVVGTNISRKGLEQLKNALPYTKVISKGP